MSIIPMDSVWSVHGLSMEEDLLYLLNIFAPSEFG